MLNPCAAGNGQIDFHYILSERKKSGPWTAELRSNEKTRANGWIFVYSRWVPSNTWKRFRRRSSPMWFASCCVSVAGRWETLPFSPNPRSFNILPGLLVCYANSVPLPLFIANKMHEVAFWTEHKKRIFFRRRMNSLYYLFLKEKTCGTHRTGGDCFFGLPPRGLLCLAIHSLNFAESASI